MADEERRHVLRPTPPAELQRPRRPRTGRTTLVRASGATALLPYSQIANVDPATGQVGLVLDVAANIALAGAGVDGYTPKTIDNDNQLWAQSGGNLVNRLAGLALDIFRGDLAAGTQLITYTVQSPPAQNQLWTLTGGRVQSQAGDLVVDLDGTTPGDSAIVNPPGDSSTQRWQLVPSYPLQAILGGSPTPFPAFAGAQLAAFTVIQATLGFGVRAQYANLAKNPWTLLAQVNAVARPDNIPAPDWSAVTSQLAAEIGMVADVRDLFAQYNQFHTDLFVDRGERVGQLIADATLDTSTTISGFALSVLESVMYSVLSALGPEASVLANVLSSAINAGLTLGTVSADPFEVAISDLWATLSSQFEGVLAGTGAMEAAVLGDWAMLQAVDALITATGPSSLAWGPTSTARFVAQAGPAYDLAVMEMLLPARFEIMRWSQASNPQIAVNNLGNVPSYAMYQEALQDNSNLYNVYVVIAGATFPSEQALTGDVFGNGATQATFFTDSATWPFAISEQNLSSSTLMISITNQVGLELWATVTTTKGTLRGSPVQRPIPAWAQTTNFAIDFDGGLDVTVKITLTDGPTVGSFAAQMAYAGDEGQLPTVTDPSQSAGFWLDIQPAAGVQSQNVPGTIAVSVNLSP